MSNRSLRASARAPLRPAWAPVNSPARIDRASVSRLQAVVPASIRRRWDRLAILQLAGEALRLQAENDELRLELSRADRDAEHWRENALELAGETPGLLRNGFLVRL